MQTLLIVDRRFFADLKSADTDSQEKWNRPPRYLLGKLIQDTAFEEMPKLLLYEDILEGNDDIESYMPQTVMIHVDQTIRPDSLQIYISSETKKIRFINAQLTDIRKSKLKDILQQNGMMYPDPLKDSLVFIKSDYNAGDAENRTYSTCAYNDASDSVWADSKLIVQRFVRDAIYNGSPIGRLRRFIIVGKEIVQVEYFSDSDTIKRSSSIWQYSRDIRNMSSDEKYIGVRCLSESGIHYVNFRDQLGGHYDTILKTLSLLGLEFGIIDVITPNNEECYVLDVNPTPWERGLPESLVRILSKALKFLLEHA